MVNLNLTNKYFKKKLVIGSTLVICLPIIYTRDFFKILIIFLFIRLLLSIPIIIWGSKIILRIIDKFPQIILLGGILLGWIGGEMIQTDILTIDLYGNISWLTFVGALSVLIASYIFKFVKQK